MFILPSTTSMSCVFTFWWCLMPSLHCYTHEPCGCYAIIRECDGNLFWNLSSMPPTWLIKLYAHLPSLNSQKKPVITGSMQIQISTFHLEWASVQIWICLYFLFVLYFCISVVIFMPYCLSMVSSIFFLLESPTAHCGTKCITHNALVKESPQNEQFQKYQLLKKSSEWGMYSVLGSSTQGFLIFMITCCFNWLYNNPEGV